MIYHGREMEIIKIARSLAEIEQSAIDKKMVFFTPTLFFPWNNSRI